MVNPASAVPPEAAPLRRRTAILLLAGALLAKLVLAALVPLTGDEAYFLLYSRNVDWGGFYDHPPMVGWLLWLMERLGSHPLVLRLPAIATGIVLPLLVYRLLRPIDRQRAEIIGLLLLYTPIFLVFVFVTTDVGVVLFGFLSLLAVHRGVQDEALRWFVLGGVLLGLAFLSKYFAVLLGLAYAFHFLVRDRRHWRGLLVIVLAALPFGLLNLAWNWLHCWDNLMFNLFNRSDGNGLSLTGPLIYAVTLVYLFAFPLWWVVRQRTAVVNAVRRHRLGLFASALLAPLLLLAVVSVRAEVGLHWLLLFVPMAYPLYVGLDLRALRRALAWMIGFAALHVVLLLAFVVPPPSVFAGTEIHRDAVFYLSPEAFARALPDVDADFRATDSYSRSAVLSYYDATHWSVFGTGSVHARQDDRLTDWRALDGTTMLYTEGNGEVPAGRLRRFFDTVEVRRVEAGQGTFAVAVARGFDYAAYREQVLRQIRERYYRIPSYLPVGGCGFLQRHFPQAPQLGVRTGIERALASCQTRMIRERG